MIFSSSLTIHTLWDFLNFKLTFPTSKSFGNPILKVWGGSNRTLGNKNLIIAVKKPPVAAAKANQPIVNQFKKDKAGWTSKLDLNFYKGKVININILDPKNKKIVINKGTKITQRTINEIDKKKIKLFSIEETSLIGNFIASDIINEKTGKIYYEAGFEIDEEFLVFINSNTSF